MEDRKLEYQSDQTVDLGMFALGVGLLSQAFVVVTNMGLEIQAIIAAISIIPQVINLFVSRRNLKAELEMERQLKETAQADVVRLSNVNMTLNAQLSNARHGRKATPIPPAAPLSIRRKLTKE